MSSSFWERGPRKVGGQIRYEHSYQLEQTKTERLPPRMHEGTHYYS